MSRDLDIDQIKALYQRAIETFDIDLLDSLNDNIDLDGLTYEDLLNFIAYLMQLCYNHQNSEACLYILTNRDNGDYTDTNFRLPMITAIFLAELDDEVYKFIVDCISPKENPTFVYVDHMINLLHADSSEENVYLAALISDLYPEKTIEEYEALIEYYAKHEDAGNKKVYNFITEKMKDLNIYQSAPAYMQRHIHNTDKEQSEAGYSEYEAMNLADTLVESLQFAFVPYLKEAPPYLPEHIIDCSLEQDRYAYPDDLRLFRILGPRNPKDDYYDDQYVADNGALEEKDICTSYGGCRMLTCIEFTKGEDDVKDLETLDDIEFGSIMTLNTARWFTGSCDICTKKIRTKRYARRMALLRGGWRGCYCSLECILADIPDSPNILSPKDRRTLNELNTRYDAMLHKFKLLETNVARS